MAIPSRALDQKLVISSKKETAYATAVPDAALIAAGTGQRFNPEADVNGQPVRKFWTDHGLTMKGHDFSTMRAEVERDLSCAIVMPGDTWFLAWLAAFGMGNITSTQPNAGSNPTCWKHVIKPLDPSSAGKDLPYTTIYIEDAQTANLQRRILGCAIKDFSLDFPKSSPVKANCNILASGKVTTGALATPPASAVLNLLLSNDLVVKYGTQAAPTDISAQIVAGSVKFSFGWNPDDANSRIPSGGLYRSRLWVGAPQISLSFDRYVDDAASTPQDDWLAETIQEILIQVDGAQIGAGPEKHSLIVRGLAVRPTVIALGQSGPMSVYRYSFGPDDWLKQSSADVVTITVQNLQAGSYIN